MDDSGKKQHRSVFSAVRETAGGKRLFQWMDEALSLTVDKTTGAVINNKLFFRHLFKFMCENRTPRAVQ